MPKIEELFAVYLPLGLNEYNKKENLIPIMQQYINRLTDFKNKKSLQSINVLEKPKLLEKSKLLQSIDVLKKSKLQEVKLQEEFKQKPKLQEEFKWLNNNDFKGFNKILVTPNIEFANRGLPNLIGITPKHNFLQYLDEVATSEQMSKEDYDLLRRIAKMESDYKYDAENPESSASGYFLFLDSTRKSYTNQTREEFINDPKSQIRTAYKHLNWVKKLLLKNGRYDKGIKMGLTPLQIVYGMWWRPRSIINYIEGVSENYKDPQNNDLMKILNKAKKHENY